jgi:hypothetical protein
VSKEGEEDDFGGSALKVDLAGLGLTLFWMDQSANTQRASMDALQNVLHYSNSTGLIPLCMHAMPPLRFSQAPPASPTRPGSSKPAS